MDMDDIIDELGMMQMSDSAFPTGLFATSNGLERLFLDKKITTGEDLAKFNRVCLEQQVGPCDCVILADAHRCCISEDRAGIMRADSTYGAMRTVREVREASARSGTQLARCVREFHDGDRMLDWYYSEIQRGATAGTYPVSCGVCYSALGIAREKSLLMLIYGFVASTVGAALRLGMIHHFEGQKIIHGLKPLMANTARESSEKPIEEVWQFSPQLDIAQMSHECMDSKMFIT